MGAIRSRDRHERVVEGVWPARACGSDGWRVRRMSSSSAGPFMTTRRSLPARSTIASRAWHSDRPAAPCCSREREASSARTTRSSAAGLRSARRNSNTHRLKRVPIVMVRYHHRINSTVLADRLRTERSVLIVPGRPFRNGRVSADWIRHRSRPHDRSARTRGRSAGRDRMSRTGSYQLQHISYPTLSYQLVSNSTLALSMSRRIELNLDFRLHSELNCQSVQLISCHRLTAEADG